MWMELVQSLVSFLMIFPILSVHHNGYKINRTNFYFGETMLPRNVLQRWHFEQLAATVNVVQYIVHTSTNEDLITRRESNQEWTAAEVIGHLTDCERTFMERARQILTDDCPALISPDPEELVRQGCYNERDPQALLDEWRGLREAHISFLSILPDEHWMRTGIFPDHQLYNLNDHAALICWHDLLHINQMMRILTTCMAR
jgi:hypothetical protein